MVRFDNRKLRGRIIEKFESQGNFAKEMMLSERSMSLKMNGIVDFSQSEIDRAITLLKIPDNQIKDYFFREKVQ